ncbi:hypothetical protein [Marinitoga lauensis]|uniref:hypothetical protein n=1 Tax=Marinitoga lauensis TaxID=2201189 RepID=UPI001980FFB6|nr:hypothetical protein [Marinitoga lauensis]
MGIFSFNNPLNGINPDTGEKFGIDIMQWPPNINLFKIPPKVFGVNATLKNYIKIFEVVPLYGRWILNTLFYAGALTMGHLILDTLGDMHLQGCIFH